MADTASDTFDDGFWNYLTTLGFILPLVGVEELIRPYVSSGPTLPSWLCLTLIAAGLPLYQSKAIWKKFRRAKNQNNPPSLGYLQDEDSELGGAICDMVWRSVWAKWFAAQYLAINDHHPASEEYMMQIATHLVLSALTNGQLEVRGRRSGQLSYEPIPQTHWRSTALHMIKDDMAIWKMILIPRGGAEIHPNGLVIGRNQEAVQRTDQLSAYDSLIISARQFEKLWPRKDKKTDAARKRFLKTARKAGADPEEIKKLSQD